MKIIHNTYIPFGKRYLAINILGVVFTKGELTAKQLNHELIHTRQQLELLFLPFFLLYFFEWIIRVIQYRNLYAAYYNISFEREAYDNQNDLDYLKKRNLFAWRKYLKMKRL